MAKLTREIVAEIIGRCIVDRRFREALFKDPRGTLYVMGYDEVDDKDIEFFKALPSDKFSDFIAEVDARISARPVAAIAWAA